MSTSVCNPAASLRVFLERSIDYAGLFPPASLDMRRGVSNYSLYLDSPERWALGRFVLPVARLDEFLNAQENLAASPWQLSGVISANIKAELAAVDEFNRKAPGAVIDAVEVQVRGSGEIDLVRANQPPRTTVFFEFAPEQAADQGDFYKERHAGDGIGFGFLNTAPDGHGIAILDGDLRLELPLRKRGRIDAAGAGCLRRADVLVDEHGDHPAGAHPSRDTHGHTGAFTAHRIAEHVTATRLDSSHDGLRGQYRHVRSDVHGGWNAVRGNDAGSRQQLGVTFRLLCREGAKEFFARPYQCAQGQTQAATAHAQIERAAQAGGIRSLRLQERGEPLLEAVAEIEFEDPHLDQYLAGRHYEEVFSWPEQGLEVYLVGSR